MKICENQSVQCVLSHKSRIYCVCQGPFSLHQSKTGCNAINGLHDGIDPMLLISMVCCSPNIIYVCFVAFLSY